MPLDVMKASNSAFFALAAALFCRKMPAFSRKLLVFLPGGIAKWIKATDCKSVIRGFDSHCRLFLFSLLLAKKCALLPSSLR